MRCTRKTSSTRPVGLRARPDVVVLADGFTLIELMIVVAIISLLAAMAIPNYLRFQCKSKQAEVKAGLGALAASETNFFAEHNTYGTDLVFVNWEPEGAPLYLYGFKGGQVWPATAPLNLPAYDGTRSNTSLPAVYNDASGNPRYRTTHMIDLVGNPLTEADLPPTACDSATFVLGAVADIAPNPGGGALDRWTFDSKRTLTNVTNDCVT